MNGESKPQKTFFENAREALPQPLFTADLKRQAAGSYDFGFIDPKKHNGDVKYFPAKTDDAYWGVESASYGIGSQVTQKKIRSIVDTGTTLLLMPQPVLDGYYGAVKDAKNDSSAGGYVFACDAALPDFSIGFKADGGDEFTAIISGKYMNYGPVNPSDKSSQCFGGLQAMAADDKLDAIYGDVFLKPVFTVFEAKTNDAARLGFAMKPNEPTTPSPNGTPTGPPPPPSSGGSDGCASGDGGDGGDDTAKKSANPIMKAMQDVAALVTSKVREAAGKKGADSKKGCKSKKDCKSKKSGRKDACAAGDAGASDGGSADGEAAAGAAGESSSSSGADGADGADGKSGEDGADGADGADGESTKGADGESSNNVEESTLGDFSSSDADASEEKAPKDGKGDGVLGGKDDDSVSGTVWVGSSKAHDGGEKDKKEKKGGKKEKAEDEEEGEEEGGDEKEEGGKEDEKEKEEDKKEEEDSKNEKEEGKKEEEESKKKKEKKGKDDEEDEDEGGDDKDEKEEGKKDEEKGEGGEETKKHDKKQKKVSVGDEMKAKIRKKVKQRLAQIKKEMEEREI